MLKTIMVTFIISALMAVVGVRLQQQFTPFPKMSAEKMLSETYFSVRIRCNMVLFDVVCLSVSCFKTPQ